MAKSLTGKELGKGIGQRKDGLYYARCAIRPGKRLEKCFSSLADAQNWQMEQKYIRLHAPQIAESNSKKRTNNITVNEWFEIWDETMLVGKADNTRRNYRERYEKNAKEILGDLRLTDVKPLHCKAVLNGMIGDYANSTMRQTYVTLGVLFKSAKENGLIGKTSVGWCPC